MPRSSWAWLIAVAATSTLDACVAPSDGGYALALAVHTLDGQEGLLADGSDVELVVTRPDGSSEVQWLGTATDGATVTLDAAPALAAGDTVGLLLEDAGGAAASWDPDLARAYGQVTLATAPDGGTTSPVDILVTRVDEVGYGGALAEAKRRMGGMLAVVPGGDAFLFGGGRPDEMPFGLRATDQILHLAGLDEGGRTFEKIDATMPAGASLTATWTERCCGTATLVGPPDAPLVLVAGGRPAWSNGFDELAHWFLFDPTDLAVVDEGTLAEPRSVHLAIRMAGGNVLLYGGLPGTELAGATYEIWDSEDLRSRAGAHADALVTHPMRAQGAPHDGGAVVCGGVHIESQQQVGDALHVVYAATAGCNRIDPSGEVEAFDPLPVPLAAGGMAGLPDGGLVAVGGFSDPIEEVYSPSAPSFATAAAGADVWRWRPGAGWQPVATLALPRAGHALVPLADGRILVVGGTAVGVVLFGDPTDPVRCPEIYDPADNSISSGACTDAGSGFEVLAASAPGEGAIVLEGIHLEGAPYSGGTVFGVVGVGPPLTP